MRQNVSRTGDYSLSFFFEIIKTISRIKKEPPKQPPTLIHEGVHLYAMQNGIKDTSNRGVYHNRTFKELAEQRGLLISRHEKYGWTVTSPSEKTIDFCIGYGLEDIEICRQSDFYIGISGGKSGNGNTGTPRTKKPSSTRKYICPCCGNSFRATKNIRVLCMDCNEQFIICS